MCVCGFSNAKLSYISISSRSVMGTKLGQNETRPLGIITSIAAAAGGSRRRLPKAGVDRSSYVGIAYTISVKLSN